MPEFVQIDGLKRYFDVSAPWLVRKLENRPRQVVQAVDGVDTGPELEATLLEHCRGELATYKCPRSVDFVDRLPRQDNGKISKVRLRDLYR